MGHTLRLFFTFYLKKGRKGWLLRKMPEVRIKQDKMHKDNKNLDSKQFDLYVVTPVAIRVNTQV
jgi:hypothetical protein